MPHFNLKNIIILSVEKVKSVVGSSRASHEAHRASGCIPPPQRNVGTTFVPRASAMYFDSFVNTQTAWTYIHPSLLSLAGSHLQGSILGR